MKRLFATLIFCITASLTLVAQADVAEELAAARSQLESLSPDDSEAQISREQYQQLISALERQQRYEKKTVDYREQIDQLPKQIAELRKALEKPVPLKPLKKLDSRSLTELNQLQTRARATLLELESARSATGKQVRENDDKQVSLREKVGQLREKADEKAGSADNQSPLQSQIAAAESRALASRVQALELQLLTLPGQSELGALQLQQLDYQIDQQRQQVEQISEAVKQQRRNEAEKALSELESHPENAELPPPLQVVQKENQRLSDEVRSALAETEKLTQARTELDKQLKRLDRSHRTIEQQLALDIGYLGGEMRRLMLRVTRPIDTGKTYARINQLRLQNLEQEQAELDALDSAPEELALDAAQQKLLARLQDDRQKLKSRLRKHRQTLISSLSELLTVQEAYNEQIRQSSELLNENLLWHPSVPAIDLGWPGEIQRGLGELYDHWQSVRGKNVWQFTPQLGASLFVLLLATLFALTLWRYRREHEERWYQLLGNVMQDRISHTLKLLVTAPLIAAPLPLLLLSLAQWGLDPTWPDAMALQKSLQLVALVLWSVHTLYQWLITPEGLFSGHLGVPRLLAVILSRRLLSLFTLATPLLAISAYMDEISNDVIRSGIGRVLFIGVMALLATFWGSLWHQGRQLDHQRDATGWWQRSQFWLILLALTPVAGIILSLWGYSLTAGAMIIVQIIALLICMTVYIFYQTGLRWLLIEERKLAFERARARRAEILAARENKEEEPPLEENLLDLETISDQARVLLKAASLILLVSLFWWWLGDLLPTLVVLDNIPLWSSTISGEGGDILQPITLQDLLIGLLVLMLSLLAAYNLPGLLELLVLRHLTLSPGTGYAITTMVKYLLILIGVTSGFSQLGFAWSKLQWLVAALGVGLGFGLQEIVANFVSGVIILFEKPVRIGDTVTVGNLTGTVTRIQMRATTITDWDRKEVIIPNKTFITDQLINWSLSDAVTRVVIPVGVAYGSDTALVRSLLLEVARNNRRLLDDPEPQAFFLGFGDSALNFDLRVYVAAMADRLEVANELNEAIDAAFKAHNIEIPFPQMQIHLPKDRDNPVQDGAD